ncbi:MAG: O-antigen ligase family protein, partial [Kofleriaceae bacterium]
MRRRDSISLICAAIGLGFTVLAVGGALRWTAAVSAILVGVALVPFVLSRRGLIGTSPLVVALGAAAALTAVQLIPLPAGLIEALDPSGSALRDDGARIAGVAPWQALTLDAPGTLRALAFFLTLLGVAVLAIRFASSERGRLNCLGAVAAVCGATALIVGIHRIFGATSLYGVYVPNQATPPVLGPLLNPNHLGGLMALGAVVSTGLVIYARQSMAARAIWGLSALGCLGVASLTLSRGAILGLATGLGVTLGIVVAQRLAPTEQSRSSRRRFLINTLPIGTVAVCVLVVIVYTSAGSAAEQLANTSLQEIREPKSKYAAWRSSVALIEESPWVGVGRGAFEPAFTRVHPASAFVTFSHLENEYIQAVVEWGVPGALLLAALLGWLAIVAIRKWRDGPLAAAALGGVTTAIVQSNVDFGIELLGLAVPVTIVAATLATVPVKPLSPRVLLRARLFRLAHLGGLAAAALVLLL